MSWKTDGYLILKKVLSKDLAQVLAREFRMSRDVSFYLSNIDRRYRFAFGDELVRNSYVRYSLLGLESLQDTVLKSIIEKRTGLKLLPTYTYGRIYYRGAEMAIHRDRPSCEVSATCCFSSDGTDWPIGLVNRAGKKILVHQSPGDVLIYSGCELQHWRDKYKGNEQIQGFVHYVQDKPKNKKWHYDGRAMLGLDPVNRETAAMKKKTSVRGL